MFANFLLLMAVVSAAPLACAAGKPVVIAHRGGAALRPENTLAAFRHALKLGVPVLEFDMNLTADGGLVIHHDSTINPAICHAPSGSALKPGPIASLTMAAVAEFDCGSFQRPASPNFQSVSGEKMPTLDAFLSAVKSSGALLLGETKMAAGVSPDRFIDVIYAALKRHGVTERFILQSADYRTIDAMRKKDPAVRLCLLNARQYKPAYLEVARRHHATHLMLRAEVVTAEQVRQLRAAGLILYSGTANSAADWQKYVTLGFDGILTDDPQGLQAFLDAAHN